MIRRLLLFSSFIIISSLSLAQPFFDVAEMGYNTYTNAPYKDNPGASANTSIFKGSFTAPVELKSGPTLLFGIDHLHHFVNYQSDSASYLSELSSTNLRFVVKMKMRDPKWSWLVLVVPKVNADFRGLALSDMQLGGGLIFVREYSPTFKLKFGAYYNREFWGNYYMALLGIDWNVNKRLNIFGILPSAMNIEYKLRQKMYLTLVYRNTNYSFRSAGSSSDYYVRDGDKFWGDAQLSLVFSYYPAKNIMVSAGIGQTCFRYFQEYDKLNLKVIKDPAFQPFRDQQFLSLGVAYRIRLDDKPNPK